MANVSTIMTADESGAEMVDFARKTAKELVNTRLSTTQIRNIFTEVRKIEAMWETKPNFAMRRLIMLKPKLAYQTVRNKEVSLLRDVLTKAIDEVNVAPTKNERDERFRRFMDLFEAILAYHRAEGGR
jgi:CRISPR-associated protein Csm2